MREEGFSLRVVDAQTQVPLKEYSIESHCYLECLDKQEFHVQVYNGSRQHAAVEGK